MRSEPLEALTLWPEWAWAICHRNKRIENRTWPPPKRLIGKWIAIHAGKHIGGRPGDDACLDGLRDLDEMADEAGAEIPYFSDLIPMIVTSAIVCLVKVSGCIENQEPEGWYNGSIGWQLSEVINLETPVKCRGWQGLWIVPQEIVTCIPEVRRCIG